MDRAVENAVYGLLGGDAGIDVAGRARQLAVSVLSVGMGAVGVLLVRGVSFVANVSLN